MPPQCCCCTMPRYRHLSLLSQVIYLHFYETWPLGCHLRGGCSGPSHRPHPLCTPLVSREPFGNLKTVASRTSTNATSPWLFPKILAFSIVSWDIWLNFMNCHDL